MFTSLCINPFKNKDNKSKTNIAENCEQQDKFRTLHTSTSFFVRLLCVWVFLFLRYFCCCALRIDCNVNKFLTFCSSIELPFWSTINNILFIHSRNFSQGILNESKIWIHKECYDRCENLVGFGLLTVRKIVRV